MDNKTTVPPSKTATLTVMPSKTPIPTPSLTPTTTPPSEFIAFAGTPLPEGPLAVINQSNAGGLQQLSRLGKGWVFRVAYSPDGTLMALSSSIGIYLYDALSREEVSFIASEGGPFSVAFTPDGETLASGSRDGTVRLWRVSDGAMINTLEGHSDMVGSVAFASKGETVASGSSDGTVRLWRVADGALLKTLEGHTSSVEALDFSQNGKVLVSGSSDGTIRLWGLMEK